MKRLIAVLALLGATLVAPSAAMGSVRAVSPDGKPFTVGSQAKKASWSSPAVVAQKKVPTTGGVSALRTSCASPCYLYEGGRQDFTAPNRATSVAMNLRVKNPYVDFTNDAFHSLQETAVINGSGSTRDIVEVGWTKDSAVCGSSVDPCLFTYAWLNGVGQGYNAAGGFVDNGTCALNAGDSLAFDVSNVAASSQWGIVWDGPSSPANDGWWISYTNNAGVGCYVGYYPQTIWSSAGKTFVDANRVENFLEIAAKRTEPCSDFGSGDAASVGTPASASATSVTILPVGTAGTSLTLYSTPTVTNPLIKSVQYSSASTTRSIYFGGRGWNSAGTGGGTKGSC